MMYTQREIPEGKNLSAQRGSRLVFVSSRLDRSRLFEVTSRYTTSSVKTWVLVDGKIIMCLEFIFLSKYKRFLKKPGEVFRQ